MTAINESFYGVKQTGAVKSIRIGVFTYNAFDQIAVETLLRPEFPDAEFVEFGPDETMDHSQKLAVYIVLWAPSFVDLLSRFDYVTNGGNKTPLLIVVENDRLSLSRLRNVPLMGVYAKTDGSAKFVEAVRAVVTGGTYFSDGIRLGGADRNEIVSISSLSRRERELLPLLAEGLPLREAATKLGIGYKTADAHRTALFRKLGVRDRVGLVRLAIREGFATL